MTAPFIHQSATVGKCEIGSGTRVWQFVVIMDGASIGKDCNICSHVLIEGNVEIGDRVTVKSGVQLWDGVTLEEDVFVGPNVTFTNDPFPRSKKHPAKYSPTHVKKGASIGANATILPGLTIGQNAMVGAGAVVTSDIPPGTIVAGNPARVIRYVGTQIEKSNEVLDIENANESKIKGVQFIDFTSISDIRGSLTVTQWNKHLPFPPQRVFFIHKVPNKSVRGEHAHRMCIQVLVAIAGSVHVVLDDSRQREEYLLQSSSRGLLIPPGIWASQYRYSHDSVLVVFASHDYDESDYIRDYDEFLLYASQKLS